MDETDLNELSKVAGVDLGALRRKYQKNSEQSAKDQSLLAQEEDRAKDGHHRFLAEDPTVKSSKEQDFNQLLSKYNICKACQGLGTVKTIYNFITMEKTCEECDGESIVLQEGVDKIVHAEHMER